MEETTESVNHMDLDPSVSGPSDLARSKVKNIGFDGYIDTWILQMYRWIFLHEYRYIRN